MTAELVGEIQGRPEMIEKPRLFDDLNLVALPTAVGCARLFVKYTLDNWKASAFVVADAMTIVGELVAGSIEETGVRKEEVRWSELDYINRIVVRLLGFPRHVVIEVWDRATQPAALPSGEPAQPQIGLSLVDAVAHRWASAVTPTGRLTWAAIAVYDRTDSGLPIRPSHPASSPVPPPATLSAELLGRVRDGLIRL
jgi:hypothetical protein